MTGSDDEVTPAGWYRQSEDPGHLRWWDGEDWTDDRMPLPAGYGKAAPRGAAKAAPAAAPPPIRIERAAEGGVRTTGARPTGARGAGSRPASAKPAPAVGGRTRKAPAKRMSRPTDSARPAERSERRPDGARAGDRPRSQQPVRAQGARVDASHRAGSTQVVARRSRSAPLAVRVGLRAVILAGVLGLLYLGYTTLRDAEPERARTLSESPEPVAAEDSDATPLPEAVLRLNDLPTGWAEQAHDPATEDICAGRRPASVIVPAEVARSGFSMGAGGPFLVNSVSRFANDREAQAYLDLLAHTVDSCRAYEVEGSTVRLEPLSFPSLGDETFAAQVTGDSLPQPISGHIVHLRVGTRVASFETVAFGESTVDQELVELLARLVARRL